MKEQKETLIEEGTEFKGSFSSHCPIVVKGRIDGDISAPSLVVSKTGSVSGTVKVKEIRCEGELAGEYDADAIYLSGSVKDNTVIRARVLEVKLAPEKGKMQVIFGECQLEVGDIPSKEEAIAEALSASAVELAPEVAPPPEDDAPIGLPDIDAPRQQEASGGWSATPSSPPLEGSEANGSKKSRDKKSERPTGKGTLPPPAP